MISTSTDRGSGGNAVALFGNFQIWTHRWKHERELSRQPQEQNCESVPDVGQEV